MNSSFVSCGSSVKRRSLTMRKSACSMYGSLRIPSMKSVVSFFSFSSAALIMCFRSWEV